MNSIKFQRNPCNLVWILTNKYKYIRRCMFYTYTANTHLN